MLRYIELKTGYSDNGPAWIGRVKLSKSARTVYFNGKALKRSRQQGAGSHFDLQTGNDYWVSEVKKNGQDRHRCGSGKVDIEASAVTEYLELIGAAELDKSRFRVVPDFEEPDPSKFHDLENEAMRECY